MSVVVGIKQDNKIYLGADSQVTRGGTRVSLSNHNNYKIWKVKGVDNCLMASVGNLRDACVLRILDDLVDEIDVIKNRINFKYVVTKIVPRIIKQLKEYGYIQQQNNFEGFDSRFLFAYKDQLFLIGNDGSVIEIDDCVAIGSGESEAIGSLIATADNDNPEYRIVTAIKSCATHDIYVDYPIVLTNTENAKFDVISK